MNYEDLKNAANIDEKELPKVLEHCGLPTQLSDSNYDYSSEDLSLVTKYHQWVMLTDENLEAEKTYWEFRNGGESPYDALEQVREMFDLPSLAQDKSDEPIDHLESPDHQNSQEQSTEPLLAMLQSAQELTGKPLTLSRATELLKVSGLSEKAAYTRSESQRFLATCDAVINQGAGMAEVAIKNGVKADSLLPHLTGSTATIGATHLQQQMMETAININEQVLETYEQTYLNRVAQMLSSGEMEDAFRIKSEERRLKRGKSVFEVECENYQKSLSNGNYLTIEANSVESPLLEGKTEVPEPQGDF